MVVGRFLLTCYYRPKREEIAIIEESFGKERLALKSPKILRLRSKREWAKPRHG
jgi:hypothetical protein